MHCYRLPTFGSHGTRLLVTLGSVQHSLNCYAQVECHCFGRQVREVNVTDFKVILADHAGFDLERDYPAVHRSAIVSSFCRW